jgi:hypothetical protein
MNHDGQVWHDTLWASSGALSLGKCQYHLMEWQSAMSGAPVLQGGKYGIYGLEPTADHNAGPKVALTPQVQPQPPSQGGFFHT